MSQMKDVTGQRFGRLLVVHRAANRYQKAWWVCRCDCGTIAEVAGSKLRNGHTKSCGCGSAVIATHRMKRSPEYTVWNLMRQRCADLDYADYGGRGITVCARWQDSFENFFADMGPRPSRNHQIDRIDNSAGYSPGNCRWATRIENCNNRRDNVRVEWRGESLTVPEWARRTGITKTAIWQRLHVLNWSVEKALTTPVRQRRRSTDDQIRPRAAAAYVEARMD